MTRAEGTVATGYLNFPGYKKDLFKDTPVTLPLFHFQEFPSQPDKGFRLKLE